MNTYKGLSTYDPYKTHDTPSSQTPAWLPISSELSPRGPPRVPEGGVGGRHKGGDHGQCQGWLTAAGEAQLLLSEGKARRWQEWRVKPGAAHSLPSKDTRNTVVKRPNNTRINKQTEADFEAIQSPESN